MNKPESTTQKTCVNVEIDETSRKQENTCPVDGLNEHVQLLYNWKEQRQRRVILRISWRNRTHKHVQHFSKSSTECLVSFVPLRYCRPANISKQSLVFTYQRQTCPHWLKVMDLESYLVFMQIKILNMEPDICCFYIHTRKFFVSFVLVRLSVGRNLLEWLWITGTTSWLKPPKDISSSLCMYSVYNFLRLGPFQKVASLSSDLVDYAVLAPDSL